MDKERYSVTFEDTLDDTLGICLECGEANYEIKHTDRACECGFCGEMQVYGIKLAIVSKAVDIAGIWERFRDDSELASLGNGLVTLRVRPVAVGDATRWMYQCNDIESKEVFATKDDAKVFCVSLVLQLLDLAAAKLAFVAH